MSSTLYDYRILSAIAQDNGLPEIAHFINEKQLNRIALMGLNDDLIRKLIPRDVDLQQKLSYFINEVVPKINQFNVPARTIPIKKPKRKSIPTMEDEDEQEAELIESQSGIGVVDKSTSNSTSSFYKHQLKKPWPIPFKYPKHRLNKQILNKLNSQANLTHRDNIYIIQMLFLEMKEYIKYYATAGIYEDAAKSIIEAYPYLKDDSETGFNSYRVQLKNKFKEFRRSLENPEIIDKRIKFGKSKKMGCKRRKPIKKNEIVNEEDDEMIVKQGDSANVSNDETDTIITDGGNLTEEEGFVAKPVSNSSIIVQQSENQSI